MNSTRHDKTSVACILSFLLIWNAVLRADPPATQRSDTQTIQTPADLPGVLAFWDFQEPSGTPKVSKGRHQYVLEEMNGPIQRIEDGVFGPYCADLEWGQWFRGKREEVPGLNLHGDRQEVSMVAWVKLESGRHWQYIAGIWSEGDKKFLGEARGTGNRYPARQYALFTDGRSQTDYTTYKRVPVSRRAMGYLSPFGGATPQHPYAFDYATGGTTLTLNQWHMIAFTYDKEWIKVYVDGVMDKNGNYNPFRYEGPIFDGGPDGADFTVALRNHPDWPNYPERKPSGTEGFDGRIGGLAVFDRALTPEEIHSLYQAVRKEEKR
ncbi:MAG TPA: LamG domain-containing protein [Planctomicrobium sp.]|nr:LamG domain-containing protein [Planctomicrobium sp.]